jgi:hypothetical protein
MRLLTDIFLLLHPQKSFVAARCAMSLPEHPPPHALFVQWGKFKAGAFGIPAIITLGLIALACSLMLGLS